MNGNKFFIIIAFFLLGFTTLCGAQDTENEGLIPDLNTFCSNQKGFNLLGKFDVNWSNSGYTEKEFSVIHNLGFNFVRLPIDYRTYTLTGNWKYFIESEVKEIDAAIEWGKRYNVHVCINLHRAPGYCVNSSTLPANQQLDLWTDTVAQNVFVQHWEYFANRYKDISPSRLSFNLVNEPSNVSETDYVNVMSRAIQAIHAISPNRLVFVDGLDYGRKILLSLKDEPNVAQAIHSYDPFSLTHYKASWVNGSSDWPVPQWPMLWISSYLYGPWKSEFKSSLKLQGNFTEGTEIIVNVRQVSTESTLKITAGNKVVLTKRFVCSAEPGSDFTKIIETQWGYQNISNLDFTVTLNETATSLVFENSAGDWMTINSISIKNGEKVTRYNLSDNTWGSRQGTYNIDENGALKNLEGNNLLPFENYQMAFDSAKAYNIPIMVQEFGVHNETPHKVAVDFLADLSDFFRENNMGWALWNLTGSFGILNSSRKDCSYETYLGYKLDREMLDALTKSGTTFSSNTSKLKQAKVFPSPAKNEIFFSSPDFSGPAIVEIRDITGRLYKTFNTEMAEHQANKFNISGMSSGLYILTAVNNKKSVSAKFLIE